MDTDVSFFHSNSVSNLSNIVISLQRGGRRPCCENEGSALTPSQGFYIHHLYRRWQWVVCFMSYMYYP